jgi:hypothetical protein
MYPRQIINLAAEYDSGLVGVGFVFDKAGGVQFGKHLALDAALFITALFLTRNKR